MIQIDIFHTAFEESPRHVATLRSTLPLEEALEAAFTATQNLETAWVETREQPGLSIQPRAEIVAAHGCRSTSMGDYARIIEEGTESFWRCCTGDWRQISAMDAKLVGQAAINAAFGFACAS